MWDIAALEGHWLACMASAGGGGKLTRLGAATILANPRSGLTMLNCMLLKSAAPDRLEPLLEIGRIALAEFGRPSALFLSPLSGALPELEAVLSERGWRLALRQVVLVRPLDLELPETPPAPKVEVTGDLEEWGRLLAEAYEVPVALSHDLVAAWSSVTGQARHYLTYLEGRPVGTGLTWQQGPIAGLYAGAVLPGYRRRGAERASLLRRLADARRAGARMAVLQTEAGSPVERLCEEQLGFQRGYERTLWLPPTAPGRTRYT